ncbi:MAG: molybdopterin converting factor subunit 1 [Acidobacteriota bacterium]
MSITVRLFASLRDIVGESEVILEFEGQSTTREVFEQLGTKFPGLKRYEPVVLIAVNQEYGDWEQSIAAGDEVAFFPPVSGG